MANCRYCGSKISIFDTESNVCNPCLYAIGNNKIAFSNLIGGNRDYFNYNQSAINGMVDEELEIEKYKKEVLGIKKKKVAK